MRFTIALLAASAVAVEAATVTFNWNVTWVWAAPDGFGRPVIGINNQWPPPPINVNLNDQIVINLTNGLGNETTALHYHGENQGKSSQMEGAAGVSQCAVPPNITVTYNFKAGNTGTHWYHSHLGGSYLDGFRGPLIVHDTTAPYYNSFDQEVVMYVSDWYHEQAPILVHNYQTLRQNRPNGAEPVPDSTLINDQRSVSFTFVPGTRYLFRIISVSGFANHLIYFEGHNMTIVEMDGVATVPTVTPKIKIAAAQRYTVIVTALNSTASNYGIVSAMDPSMFSGDLIPADYQGMTFSYAVYNPKAAFPKAPVITDYTTGVISESTVQPFDQQTIFGPVTQEVATNFNFTFIDGVSRGTMNGTTYLPQVVPTLYTALSAPAEYILNPKIYGNNSNVVIFNNPTGIVEVVVNNLDNGAHPFHIHGHTAQIVAQGPTGTTTNQAVFNGTYISTPPARRDVFMVNANSYAIIRFKSTNPGIWLFHCHIEWHIEAGLVMTFVEDPIQLQAQNLTIPQNMLDACAAQGIPTIGNAGGDAVNWLNLTNSPQHPPQNIWGALIVPPGAPSCPANTHLGGSGLKFDNYTLVANGGSNGNGNYGNGNNGNYQKFGCLPSNNNPPKTSSGKSVNGVLNGGGDIFSTDTTQFNYNTVIAGNGNGNNGNGNGNGGSSTGNGNGNGNSGNGNGNGGGQRFRRRVAKWFSDHWGA